MNSFMFNKTMFENVYLIDNFYHEDERGYFFKDYEKDIFEQFGLNIDIYESFESFSRKNVIRGLHFQTSEPQAKLVRAITGSIYDIIVDLRIGSKTFGNWQGFSLNEKNKQSLFIPKGFAHGFHTVSESALVSYKCIGKYNKGSDSGIIWNDNILSIDWNIENPIISDRDSELMTFNDFKKLYNALEC